MMLSKFIGFEKISVIISVFVFAHSMAFAQNENEMNQQLQQETIENLQKDIEQAHREIEEAKALANTLILQARLEAEKIRMEAVVLEDQEYANLADLKSEVVSLELYNVSVSEIYQALLPSHWRVLLDHESPEYANLKLSFIAHKSRDEAIAEISQSLGLEYRYYFHLTDETGLPSPLLVVSENQ